MGRPHSEQGLFDKCESTYYSRSAAGAHRDRGHLFFTSLAAKLENAQFAQELFCEIAMKKRVQVIEKIAILLSGRYPHLYFVNQVSGYMHLEREFTKGHEDMMG